MLHQQPTMFGILQKKEVLQSAERSQFQFQNAEQAIRARLGQDAIQKLSPEKISILASQVERIRDINIRRLQAFNSYDDSYVTLNLGRLELDDTVLILLTEELIQYNDTYGRYDDPPSPIKKIVLSDNSHITDTGINPLITLARFSPWLVSIEIDNLPKASKKTKEELIFTLKQPASDREKLLGIRNMVKGHGDHVKKLYENWVIVRVWSPEIVKLLPSLVNLLKYSIGHKEYKDVLVTEEDGEFTTSKARLAIAGHYSGQWGHVSLQTLNEYASLWPDTTPNSAFQPVHSCFNTLSDDFRDEDGHLPKCTIVLHLLDAREMEKGFKEITCKYQLANRKKLSASDENEITHNCSSIVVSLLKAGISSIDQLLEELSGCNTKSDIVNQQSAQKINTMKKEIISEIDALEKEVVSPNHVAHLIAKAKEMELLLLQLIGFSHKEIEDFDRLPSNFFVEKELNPNFQSTGHVDVQPEKSEISLVTFQYDDISRPRDYNQQPGSTTKQDEDKKSDKKYRKKEEASNCILL